MSVKTYSVAIVRGGIYGYYGAGAGLATSVRAKSIEAAVIKAAALLGLRNKNYGKRHFRPTQVTQNGSHTGHTYAVCAPSKAHSRLTWGFATAIVVEGVAFDHGAPAEVVIDYATEYATA